MKTSTVEVGNNVLVLKRTRLAGIKQAQAPRAGDRLFTFLYGRS